MPGVLVRVMLRALSLPGRRMVHSSPWRLPVIYPRTERGLWRTEADVKRHKMPKKRLFSGDFLNSGEWERTGFWRRRRDSNPRYAFGAYNGLANRRLQPLGHVSASAVYL